MADSYRYRAGDEVLHVPTGETWTLACDEQNGYVIPGGWPETHARASDLQLINKATPGNSLRMLKEAARGSGTRAQRAQAQLKARAIDWKEEPEE